MKLHRSLARLHAVTLLVLIWPAASAVGQDAGGAIDTGFRPSKDMPVVQNRHGRFNAINGECNGIDELAETYYRWRKQYPRAPGLAECTDFVKTIRGDNYVRSLMDLATEHSLAHGQPDYRPAAAATDPSGFQRTLVDKLRSTGEPLSIVVTPPPGSADSTAHRITVYGAQRVSTAQGERWEFKVADSNMYGRGDVDAVRLAFAPGSERGQGRWVESVQGQPVQAWSGGDVVHSAPARPSTYVDLITKGMQGRPLGEIRTTLGITQEPPSPTTTPGTVTAVKDPKAGGVVLQFDPALFSGEGSEADLQRLEERYRAFLARGDAGGAVFRLRQEELDLRLVPLAGLHGPTIGGLTRVRGYVRAADGRLYIVGQREPGRAAIPLDDLVVALRAAYANSGSPFVSLDPEQANPAGSQHVRMGDIAPELRSSGYVRAMLDADYLMKRINLGREKPRIEGFQRWVDIVRECGLSGASVRNRMWLSPLAAPVGDVLVSHRGSASAVLFESHVQVLSEAMKLAADGMSDAGASSQDSESAAGQLTRHFDELAGQYPAFARLQGVFDVTKLAVALRAFGVRSAELDSLESRRFSAVTVPTSYAGIGPDWVSGTDIVVSGGAISGCRLYSRAAIATDTIAPLIDAAGRTGAAHVTLPAEFDVETAAAAGFRAEQFIARARQAFADGDADEVLSRTAAVLAVDPDHPEALTLRIGALISRGHAAEAADACTRLAAQRPEALATRALMRASMGDRAGERRDLEEALRRAPDCDEVKVLAVQCYIAMLDLPAARRALARLEVAAPTHPVAHILRLQIGAMARRTPEEARRYLQLIRDLPPDVRYALCGAASAGDTGRGVAALELAVEMAESGEFAIPPELDFTFIARCDLMVAYKDAAEASADARPAALTRGDALYAKLTAQHPNRAMPYILRAYVGAAAGEDASRVETFVRAGLSRTLDGDPFYPDLREELNTPHVAECAALDLWVAYATPLAPAAGFVDAVASHVPADQRPFLAALTTGSGPDVAVILRAGIERVHDMDAAAKRRALDCFERLTRLVPPTIAGDDASYSLVARLYAFQLLLAAQLDRAVELREAASRALRLLRANRARMMMGHATGVLPALVWGLLGELEKEEAIHSASRFEHEFDQRDAEMQRLLEAPHASTAALRRVMGRLADVAEPTFHSIGSDYRRRLARIEAAGGATSYRAVELIAALSQEGRNGSDSPCTRIRTRYPALASTPEYARLARFDRTLSRHTFTPLHADTIWSKLVTSCSSADELNAIGTYAEVLREMAEKDNLPGVRCSPALVARLRGWEADARVRAAM